MSRLSVLSLASLALGAAASLALPACGGCNDNDQNGHLADAPPMIDAAADAANQPVTLTITNHGEPAKNVHVYFLQADGTVAANTHTDGAGVASAMVAAGGSVTALKPFNSDVAGGKFSPDEIRTFVGVKPGDHLVLTRTALDGVSFTLDAKAATENNAFQTLYDVYTTCGQTSISPGGGGGGSGSPDPGGNAFLQGCGGAADVAIVARQQIQVDTLRAGAGAQVIDDGFDWIAGLYHGDSTLTEGGNVDLRAVAYQDLIDAKFTFMNAPAESTIDVLHSPILPHGPLSPFGGATSSGALTLHEASTPATKAIVQTSLSRSNQHRVIDWGDFTTDYKLDFENLLLRELIEPPGYDFATGKILWEEATTGAAPDFTIVTINVRRPDPLAKWRWEIVAPYTNGQLALPKLPTDVLDWAPAQTDDVSFDPILNVKVSGGYDAVRAHALDIHDQTGATGYVTATSGRAVTVTPFLE